MRILHQITLSPVWLECGWGIGLAAFLLQLTTDFMPPGEQRDWLQYYLLGACAAFYVFSSLLAPLAKKATDFALCQPLATALKFLFSAYAVCALSYYFLAAVTQWTDTGLWVLALLLADAWLRRLPLITPRQRIVYGAAMTWFLLCAFSMGRTLAYRIPELLAPPHGNPLPVVALFMAGVAFVIHRLWKPYGMLPAIALPLPGRLALHLLALWVLMIPFFDTSRLLSPMALHHWKAFLEPAASLRSGGWLLWDVPSQYGFLQTLAIAAFPAATVWQSFYLLNGAVLSLCAYMVFSALYAHYRSGPGFAFCLLVALACTTLFLPMGNGPYFPTWTENKSGTAFTLLTTGSPMVLPSSGPWRFLFVFLMNAYVFALRRFFYERSFRAGWYYAGNALWFAGVLWSLESAAYVTLLWIPALVIVTFAELVSQQEKPGKRAVIRLIALRLGSPAAWALAGFSVLTALYIMRIGHAPDLGLTTAYARAYIGGFNVFAIKALGEIPCWLLAFGGICVLAKLSLRAPFTRQALLNAAALYVSAAGLWAVCSYYIPLSDDIHLACTLPLAVYVSAKLLGLLPQLGLPDGVKTAYEKSFLCLCGVMLWVSASYFDAGIYTRQSWFSPIHPDITQLLPAPPKKLQALLDTIHASEPGPVLVLARAYAMEEDMYIRGTQPWLLPNTLVGYELPLPQEWYHELALRRTPRMVQNTGWIIERKDHPLEEYGWIKSAIDEHYKQVQTLESDEYRIRKYVRVANPL